MNSQDIELTIVLPCYNESKNLPVLIERFSKFWPKVKFELILVNNGSTDDSAAVMDRLQRKYEFIRIKSIQKNIGYGDGVMKGLKESRADVLSYSHADIQTPPEDIFKAYEKVKTGQVDIRQVLIKGCRVNRRPEELFLTKGLARFTSFILGCQMEDINGQPKMFSKKLLSSLQYPPTNFAFDLYMMYIANLRGLRTVEFPVNFEARLHGESKWASTLTSKWKTIFQYIVSILKIAVNRMKESKNDESSGT